MRNGTEVAAPENVKQAFSDGFAADRLCRFRINSLDAIFYALLGGIYALADIDLSIESGWSVTAI